MFGRTFVQAAPAVAGDLDVAVVGPDPQQAGPQRRLADRDDRPVRFGPGRVVGHPAGRLVFLGIVGRQVGADDHPLVAAVRRLEQVVSAQINRPGIVGRKDDRRAPIVPERARAIRGPPSCARPRWGLLRRARRRFARLQLRRRPAPPGNSP